MEAGDGPRRMPMFPLGSVLFPGELLPLHVFESRYRYLIEHTLASGHAAPAAVAAGGPNPCDAVDQHRTFGVVLIERGSEVGGGDARFAVGTQAEIVQSTRMDDGRHAVMARGVRRLAVERWLPDDPHPWAAISFPHDEAGIGADAARYDAHAELVRLAALAFQAGIGPAAAEPRLAADSVRASYEAAALLPVGPLDRQRLLEAPDAATRLAMAAALAREVAMLLELRLRGG